MTGVSGRITLQTLRQLKQAGRRFAMLTAYDYPTAQLAQQAGVHSLLVGDSLACVILGHPSTRQAPLDLMVTLAEAVRRGAPDVYLVGDLPYEATCSGPDGVVAAARRFCRQAGCDAVKFEAPPDGAATIAALQAAGIQTIAHLGLRPQTVTSPEGYKAQARDQAAIAELVESARRMVAAGAVMLLLEAVPAEASAAVVAAVDVPVIGCGAGPACHGHVVVTQDMIGLGTMRPPRFVPRYAQISDTMLAAMRRWVDEIAAGSYPAPQHVYPLRREQTS